MRVYDHVVVQSLVFLLFSYLCVGQGNLTDDADCNGPCWPKRPKKPDVVVDLQYASLRAQVWYHQKLPVVGNDPNHLWNNLAKKMRRDADSRFPEGVEASRYDIWPRIERNSQSEWRPDKSWLVRCTVNAEVSGRFINHNTIQAISNLFVELNTKATQYSFSGNVSDSSIPRVLYQVRCYPIGASAAESTKVRTMDRSDLSTIDFARQTILKYTSPDDLVLFLGGSGAYFYYALNRPDDRPADRRKAYLLPMSGARDWSKTIYLDRVAKTPQFRSFTRHVLRDIFERPPYIGRKTRIIVVDHVCSGMTLGGFRNMLIANDYRWDGSLYLINIKESYESNIPSGYQKIGSIRIASATELDLLRHGGFGRVVPPYPWQYWDVAPRMVEYPDKWDAKKVINFIQSKGKSWSGSGLSSNATGNETDESAPDPISSSLPSVQRSLPDQSNINDTALQYHVTADQAGVDTSVAQNRSLDAVVNLNNTNDNGVQCTDDDGDWGGKDLSVPTWGCDDPDQTCINYLSDGPSANGNGTLDLGVFDNSTYEDDGAIDDGSVNIANSSTLTNSTKENEDIMASAGPVETLTFINELSGATATLSSEQSSTLTRAVRYVATEFPTS